MKIGEYVVCIDNEFYENTLKVGIPYKVSHVSSMHARFFDIKEHGNVNFNKSRFKKIDDNSLNRLLYPEIVGR